MFIDKEWKKETSKIPTTPEEGKRRGIVIYLIGACVIIFGFLLFFIINKNSKPRETVLKPTEDLTQEQVGTSPTGGFLPEDNGNNNDDQYAIGSSTQNIKAEDLTFGHFYEKIKDDFKSELKGYDLPINIKVDVSNYRDVSRKMDLDPYIEDFNQYGFAVMDAPASLANTDFFAVYKYLLEKEIPIALTEDFLLYYNQNTLKQVFKEIEKNAFYDNVWDISKEMYDISLARYKKSLDELDRVNDPVFEGERLELAFWAIALKLLEPMESQINKKVNFSDETRFTMQDADNFSFVMPSYLQNDVQKEVDLIRKGDAIAKSPALLYERNYKTFAVPANYKNNAKLNNFYLTLKWLNSLMPLFPRSEECPECLLDRDDWLINLVATSYISKDIYENQEVKNQWAVIYKFISFFSGLRSDLTYLNYHAVLKDLFGEEYNIREIFSSENKNRDQDIKNIQRKLLEFKFLDIEGGLDRTSQEDLPYLGMRILQEDYWPNSYFLDKLIGEDMVNNRKDYSDNVTYCKSRYSENYYRCNGFSYDILNVLYPLNSPKPFFVKNTDYSFYNERINELRREVGAFDVYTWNNNVYWMTLDIGESLLRADRSGRPVFTRSQEWLEKRDFNTFLSAWANLHLTDDLFVSYYDSKNGNLGVYLKCNDYNYIEPNVDLVNDLIARNNMLVKMLTMLEVSKKTSTAAATLKELNKKLIKFLEISKKELSNEKINSDDCRFITDLAKQVIEIKGSREFMFNFTDTFGDKRRKGSIAGVKLLGMIYQHGEKKVLVIGPMFDFKEN